MISLDHQWNEIEICLATYRIRLTVQIYSLVYCI